MICLQRVIWFQVFLISTNNRHLRSFRWAAIPPKLVSKAKDASLPNFYPHGWRQKSWVHASPKSIRFVQNANSLVQNWFLHRWVHLMGYQPLQVLQCWNRVVALFNPWLGEYWGSCLSPSVLFQKGASRCPLWFHSRETHSVLCYGRDCLITYAQIYM